MNNEAMALLYINHLINPLEALTKHPDFFKNYSIDEQEEIKQFLLKQYYNLEQLIEEAK